MGGFNNGMPSTYGTGSGDGTNPLAYLLPFLAGGAGALGSTGNVSTTGSSNSTISGTGTSNVTNTPVLSEEQQQIAKAFGNGLVNQYNQGTNLQPYQQAGLQQINQAGNNSAKTIANNLASRGLSYSPAAANSETQNILNTQNQENQFNNSIPLLQHQLNQGNLSQLVQGFSALPTGSTSSGTTTQNQTTNTNSQNNQKTSTNPLAGLLSGAGAGLGLLLKAF